MLHRAESVWFIFAQVKCDFFTYTNWPSCHTETAAFKQLAAWPMQHAADLALHLPGVPKFTGGLA